MHSHECMAAAHSAVARGRRQRCPQPPAARHLRHAWSNRKEGERRTDGGQPLASGGVGLVRGEDAEAAPADVLGRRAQLLSERVVALYVRQAGHPRGRPPRPRRAAAATDSAHRLPGRRRRRRERSPTAGAQAGRRPLACSCAGALASAGYLRLLWECAYQAPTALKTRPSSSVCRGTTANTTLSHCLARKVSRNAGAAHSMDIQCAVTPTVSMDSASLTGAGRALCDTAG